MLGLDDWPDGWREEYEERAAILEYDGMMNRPQAEEWAETIVRTAYRLQQGKSQDVEKDNTASFGGC